MDGARFTCRAESEFGDQMMTIVLDVAGDGAAGVLIPAVGGAAGGLVVLLAVVAVVTAASLYHRRRYEDLGGWMELLYNTGFLASGVIEGACCRM